MNQDIDYQALGERIRKARADKGYTQERLGEACGLSTSHIGHIERGSRIPSLDTIFRIASTLTVSLDSLLFDSIQTNDAILIHISAMLQGKEEGKVRTYLSTVRALAEKIDDL